MRRFGFFGWIFEVGPFKVSLSGLLSLDGRCKLPYSIHPNKRQPLYATLNVQMPVRGGVIDRATPGLEEKSGAATSGSGKLISWDGKLHVVPLVADPNVPHWE